MSTPGRTAEDFTKLHDKNFIIPNRIKAALAELGDSWEYEGEFVKRCQPVANVDFARYRDQFTEFFFEVRAGNKGVKRIWCGTKKFAAKLREQAGA
jgi:hypothetical protein